MLIRLFKDIMLSKQKQVSLLSNTLVCHVKNVRNVMLCVKEEQQTLLFWQNTNLPFKPIWRNTLFKHYSTNIIYRVNSNNFVILIAAQFTLNSPFVCPYFSKSALYHILFISPLNVKVLTRFLNETIITKQTAHDMDYARL